MKLFAITLNQLSDFADLDTYFIFTVDMLTVLWIGLLNTITNKFINYVVANVILSDLNPDLNWLVHCELAQTYVMLKLVLLDLDHNNC